MRRLQFLSALLGYFMLKRQGFKQLGQAVSLREPGKGWGFGGVVAADQDRNAPRNFQV
jgi:hypothetical protein